MLKIRIPKYYQVKSGQNIKDVSWAFGVAVGALIRENGLTQELYEGQLLCIPDLLGDRYIVQPTDTKTLLCGSAENYEKKNGTQVFYPEMMVIL